MITIWIVTNHVVDGFFEVFMGREAAEACALANLGTRIYMREISKEDFMANI